ncbi:MAG: M56 family metallopeptidase [Oscillospiraceae bacterium]|nr:M56 family metallopeptidase [Oscillospiraceae bacterium]
MFVLFTIVVISSAETAIAAAVIKLTEKIFVRGIGLQTRSAVLTLLLCFQPIIIPLALIFRIIPHRRIITGTIPVVKISLPYAENVYFTGQEELISRQHSENIIAYVWLFIAVSLILLNLFRYFRFRLLLKKSIVREINNSVSSLRVISSSMTNSPFLMGIFKPVIILPDSALSESELSMIIRHETIHYRQRDIFKKISAVFLKCINWFNPMYYILEKMIGEISELAADEILTSGMTFSKRKEYGNILLKFAEKQSVHANAYLSGNAIKLAKRLELIMKMKKSSNKKLSKAAVFFITAAATVAVGISAAVAVTAQPDRYPIYIPLEQRPVIYVYGDPQDPVSGFSEVEDVGTKLPADILKFEEEWKYLVNNMYAVEAEQSDKEYQVEKIAYGSGQVIVLCENDDRGFSFEEGQNGIIEISADFSPEYSADGSKGEWLEVGYIYDRVPHELYSDKIYDEGLSVSFTADKAGEYLFYICNNCASLQNYNYISVEKQ